MSNLIFTRGKTVNINQQIQQAFLVSAFLAQSLETNAQSVITNLKDNKVDPSNVRALINELSKISTELREVNKLTDAIIHLSPEVSTELLRTYESLQGIIKQAHSSGHTAHVLALRQLSVR